MVTIKRALLSCYDKNGLEALSRALIAHGVELIASSGTAEFLSHQGVLVRTVEAFTGMGAQLDGRVKTLHPKIHAGILARRDDPSHVQAAGTEELIDLVVVNLYPFEETAEQPGVSLGEVIEQIDIGGVALLRAAAKNFAHVAVVSRPQQYTQLINALTQGDGRLSDLLTRKLSAAAFQLTSAYDAWIARYLGRDEATTSRRDSTPPSTREVSGDHWADVMSLSVVRRQLLRYGENPHQQAAWYVPQTQLAWGLSTLSQLQGKELSYNNLLDIDAAVRCLADFEEPTCVIIKHHSQCGLASDSAMLPAYERAHRCDPESAFGGIVGFNRAVDVSVAERLSATFLEVIVAPAVEDQALKLLRKKTHLRVVTVEWPIQAASSIEWRQLLGSWLLQDSDREMINAGSLQVATRRAPTAEERNDLLFAWKAAKHGKSNCIVIAADRATVGIGQGQPSRVGSVRLAIQKAGERARDAVAASDGFFPFPDSIELLTSAGVTAVIQPGGSIRDGEVVEAANRAKIAMLLTGARHFRH